MNSRARIVVAAAIGSALSMPAYGAFFNVIIEGSVNGSPFTNALTVPVGTANVQIRARIETIVNGSISTSGNIQAANPTGSGVKTLAPAAQQPAGTGISGFIFDIKGVVGLPLQLDVIDTNPSQNKTDADNLNPTWNSQPGTTVDGAWIVNSNRNDAHDIVGITAGRSSLGNIPLYGAPAENYILYQSTANLVGTSTPGSIGKLLGNWYAGGNPDVPTPNATLQLFIGNALVIGGVADPLMNLKTSIRNEQDLGAGLTDPYFSFQALTVTVENVVVGAPLITIVGPDAPPVAGASTKTIPTKYFLQGPAGSTQQILGNFAVTNTGTANGDVGVVTTTANVNTGLASNTPIAQGATVNAPATMTVNTSVAGNQTGSVTLTQVGADGVDVVNFNAVVGDAPTDGGFANLHLPAGASLAGYSTKVPKGANLVGTEIKFTHGGFYGTDRDIMVAFHPGGVLDDSKIDVPGDFLNFLSDQVEVIGLNKGDLFGLTISYDPSLIPNGHSEEALVRAGVLRPLILDESVANGHYKPVGVFNDSPTSTGISGQWGVNTAENYVWLVTTVDAKFIVAPEPASLSLLGGLAAFGLMRRRRAV